MHYALTTHARQRITERQLCDDALAAAIAGREVELDGRTYHYDNASRVCVVTSGNVVVTCYKMQRKQVKRYLSR